MPSVPTGTTFFMATGFAAARTVTAVSNAIEAVVTSVAHGYAAGDILEITSGWGRINKRAIRVKAPTADTFIAELIDTSNTNFFPPGTGIGSVRKVTGWTEITKVFSVSSSGGDPKPVNFKYMASDVEYSLNDGFTAVNQTLEIDADSFGEAGYMLLKSLTDVQTDTIQRTVKRNGSIILRPCTVALNEEVISQDGQVDRVRCAFSGNNRITRYAA